MPFGNGNVLEHVIRRAKYFAIEPIVCTSIAQSDDVIEEIAKREGVRIFRGSLVNKLRRWADCAEHFGLGCFHTVDADDPFFDGNEMHRSMSLLATGAWDMICPSSSSSAGGASVGYSMTTSVVRKAINGLDNEADTEMMWYYVEKVPGLRSTALPEPDHVEPSMRLTLDYPEDYWLLESVRRIVGNLAERTDVNALFLDNPDFYKINWFRNQEWKQGQLSKKI